MIKNLNQKPQLSPRWLSQQPVHQPQKAHLVLAVGLTLWGLRGSISYFYTPAQADAAKPPPGRSVQLGGLVVDGSVVKHADGRVEFTVRDNRATDRVHYQGDLPDLFREGQGIVATGAFRADGVFEARQVLAKHDETYMPQEVIDSLKAQGVYKDPQTN